MKKSVRGRLTTIGVESCWLALFLLTGLISPLISVLKRRKSRLYCDDATIWFYSEGSRLIREQKVANALIEKGFKVILLTRKAIDFAAHSQHFSDIKYFNNRLQVLWFLLSHANQLTHVFVYGNYFVPLVLSLGRHKKWILDPYDVLEAYRNSHLEAGVIKRLVERFCLKAAPGVCSRSLEIQLVKRRHQIKLRSVIFFPEYPDQILSSQHNYDVFQQHGLQALIYGGGIYDSIMLPIVSLLEQHKTASVILCSAHEQVQTLTGIQDFLDQGRIQTLGLMSHSHFIDLCGKQQVGIFLINQSFATKTPYGMANKVFDYASSGLIPLIQAEHFCCRLLKRYVRVLSYSPEAGVRVEEHFNSAERLLMRNNIDRLIHFYRRHLL